MIPQFISDLCVASGSGPFLSSFSAPPFWHYTVPILQLPEQSEPTPHLPLEAPVGALGGLSGGWGGGGGREVSNGCHRHPDLMQWVPAVLQPTTSSLSEGDDRVEEYSHWCELRNNSWLLSYRKYKMLWEHIPVLGGRGGKRASWGRVAAKERGGTPRSDAAGGRKGFSEGLMVDGIW